MISRLLLVVSLCVIATMVRSQNVTKAYVNKGNIYIQIANAGPRQLTFAGTDSQVILSRDKKYVLFLRTIKNPKQPEEGEYTIEESKIVEYTFATAVEKVLVQGCKSDGSGSSVISYADSDNYPFSGLCDISNIQLSPDGERLYFETDAWTTSRAIHYYDMATGEISFVVSGSLNLIFPNGNLNVSITGLDMENGRYLQEWLFDKNGKEIKAIGKKTF